jgi:uncharacterized membrane protein
MRASNLAGLALVSRALAVGVGYVFLMGFVIGWKSITPLIVLAVIVLGLLVLGRFLDAWASEQHEREQN